MTLFARLTARAERWLEAIDKERDGLAHDAIARLGVKEQAFIRARLDVLDQERSEAVDYIQRLRILEHRPQSQFHERPKAMLKMTLRRTKQEKRA